MQWLSLPVVFVVAFVLALILNYPNAKDQMKQVQIQASGMIEAMAVALVNLIQDRVGGSLPALIAIISMPLSLVSNPDAYYFGVMPTLAQSAEMYGVPGIEIAQASMLERMTVGFPLSPLTSSTFLLICLAQVELGDHQKFMFKWAFLTTLVMAAFALLTGVIST